MRLDVCVLSAERLLGPAGGQFLHIIDDCAAAVVSFTGETFGSLVLEDLAESRQNCSRALILSGDKLEAVVQSFVLSDYQLINSAVLLQQSVENTFVVLLRRRLLRQIQHLRVLSILVPPVNPQVTTYGP